jgi:hypothetical protein
MIHYNPIISGSLIVSGSIQVIGGEVSASLNYNNISNKPTLVSGSSQLTASLNQLYVVSGSITQTTWDNIASKPTGIVSGSEQIVGVLSSLNSFTSSIDTTIKTKINTDGIISGSSQIISILSSLNTYTGSNDTINTTQNNRLSRIEESTASLNTYTGSNDTLNTLQTTRIDQLAASTASINSYTSSNDTANTTQNNRLSRIEESTASLNSYSSSASNRLSRIEESTASLNSYSASLKTAIALTGSNVTILGNFRVDGNTTTIGGNLIVQGTTTTVSASNLTVQNNLIYLNDGGENVNLDLGWSGNYNDGTYAHAGMFRDASDGVFRAFKGYIPEPSQSIDITHASFQLADFEAANLIGVINSKNGVVSGSSQVVGILSSLNTYTGSNDTLNTLQTTRIDQLAASTASINSFTASNGITSLNSFTASNGIISLNSYTASNDTKWSTLSTLTASNAASISQINSVTASLNSKTGSYATTGSNSFIGTETITGSLVVSGSNTVIGTKTITGSVFISGSKTIIGSVAITGSLVVSGSSATFRNVISTSNSNIQVGNDTSSNGGGIALFGSGFTPSNQYRANGAYFYSNLAGGLTLHAEGINSMYLATNNTTAATISSAQVVNFANLPTVASSNMRTDANTSYSTTFTSVSSVSVTHSLGTKNVMVMCYDSADEMFWPATIKTTSTSVVDITFTVARTGRVVIIR